MNKNKNWFSDVFKAKVIFVSIMIFSFPITSKAEVFTQEIHTHEINVNDTETTYHDPEQVQYLDWGTQQTNISKLWSKGYTGKNVKVAIVDTGIDYTHPDLGGCFGKACKVQIGYDFVNNDEDPMDDNGHGTHVAATAAGNGVLKGVAPDAIIYSYKVCDLS